MTYIDPVKWKAMSAEERAQVRRRNREEARERAEAKRRNAEARAAKASAQVAARVHRLDARPLMPGCGIKVVGIADDASDETKAMYL